MLGMSLITPPPLAATPSPWQQLQDSFNNLAADPTALSIRIGLSFAVLLAALLIGRWLAQLAGRAPVHLETTLARTGRLGRRLKRTPQTSVGPWLARLTRLSVWLAALLALGAIWFSALGGQPTLNLRQFSQSFTDFAGHVGASLLVFAATLGLARVFERSLEKSLQHRVNPNLALLAGRVLYIAVLAVGFIVILTIWNTGIVLPVTLLGALTVALSLALQDVLKNLVSGVYLLLERPFTIGDRITLAPYTGVIEDIEIRYTALRTEDGQRVIIPNSMLFGSAVVNLSAYQTRRAAFTVTVPDIGADAIDTAVHSLQDALKSAPDVLPSPQPEVILTRAASGSADLRVIYWLPKESVDARAAVFSHVIEQVRAEVAGIEFSALDATAGG
jgi:small-conductance mechanosensitive channel